jgi:hypothetical protein
MQEPEVFSRQHRPLGRQRCRAREQEHEIWCSGRQLRLTKYDRAGPRGTGQRTQSPGDEAGLRAAPKGAAPENAAPQNRDDRLAHPHTLTGPIEQRGYMA